MVYSRTQPAAIAALVISATTAQAGGPQLDYAIQIPELTREQIVAPTAGGGDGGGSDGGVKILKRQSDLSKGTPADLPGMHSEEQHDRDYALVCEVSAKGALRFVNRGGETMPSGLRIKWRAGDRRGAFRLNVDLLPGASAAAPGILDDDSTKSCWAAVI